MPNAEFDPADRTIYVNQDGDFAKGSREAMQIVMEELGHHFITEAIKDDPLFARRILANTKSVLMMMGLILYSPKIPLETLLIRFVSMQRGKRSLRHMTPFLVTMPRKWESTEMQIG